MVPQNAAIGSRPAASPAKRWIRRASARVIASPTAPTASAVARSPRRANGRGADSTSAVAASRMVQRPSGPNLDQPATAKIAAAIATSAAPAASSSRAAVWPDISGR